MRVGKYNPQTGAEAPVWEWPPPSVKPVPVRANATENPFNSYVPKIPSPVTVTKSLQKQQQLMQVKLTSLESENERLREIAQCVPDLEARNQKSLQEKQLMQVNLTSLESEIERLRGIAQCVPDLEARIEALENDNSRLESENFALLSSQQNQMPPPPPDSTRRFQAIIREFTNQWYETGCEALDNHRVPLKV